MFKFLTISSFLLALFLSGSTHAANLDEVLVPSKRMECSCDCPKPPQGPPGPPGPTGPPGSEGPPGPAGPAATLCGIAVRGNLPDSTISGGTDKSITLTFSNPDVPTTCFTVELGHIVASSDAAGIYMVEVQLNILATPVPTEVEDFFNFNFFNQVIEITDEDGSMYSFDFPQITFTTYNTQVGFQESRVTTTLGLITITSTSGKLTFTLNYDLTPGQALFSDPSYTVKIIKVE